MNPVADTPAPVAPSAKHLAGDTPADFGDVTLTMTITRRARELWKRFAFAGGFALILALGYFVLNPIIGSGYLSDDSWNSQVPSAATLNDVALHTFWWDVVQGWMQTVGRFFPGSLFLAYYVYAVFDTLETYKMYQMGMLLSTLGLFTWFVFRMTSSRAIALIAGLAAVACMQMRVYFDPIVSFAGQQQALVLLVLAAALLLRRFLMVGRWWWLAAGVAIWFLALVTYETSYPMLATMALVTLLVRTTWRRRIVSMAAYAIPLFALGFFVMYLRGNVPDVGDTGYVSNFEPSAVFSTLWIQLYAAAPDSQQHFAIFRHGFGTMMDMSGISEFPHRAAMALIEALFVAVLFFNIPRVAARVLVICLGIATTMLLVPAAVIAQSKHWQENLVLGVAYISVYMEFFGLAMLVAVVVAMVRNLLRWRQSRVLAVGAAAMGLVLGSFIAVATQGTAQSNIASMKRLNDSQLYPRETFALAVAAGVFDKVEERAYVASTKDRFEPHYNSCFIHMSGGPHVRLIHPAIGLPGGPLGCAQPIGSTPETYLPEHALSVDLGTNEPLGNVWVADIDPRQPKLQEKDGTTSSRAVTASARFFVRDPRLADDKDLAPRVRCLAAQDRASIFATVEGLKRAEDWIRFDVTAPGKGCLAETMTVLLP